MRRIEVQTEDETRIPSAVLEEAGMRAGDQLVVEIAGDSIVLRRDRLDKDRAIGDDYRRAVSETLTEWTSAADEAAWRDL
jgi:antitoxin component of MazEF toxin-antitoxin module